MRWWSSALLASQLLAGSPSVLPRTYHYSFWSDDPQPYLSAIRKSGSSAHFTLAPGQTVRAGILTHHLLASELMVRFFAELRTEESPATIILIGPNHFHHGRANISLSSLPWKTPFGILQVDTRAVQRIRSAANLSEDPEAFTGEHSVGVLMPFLKYYFPHTRVVPILIDVNADPTRLRKLRPLLEDFLADPRFIVLLSMDFSHHSIATVADSRDQQAKDVIARLDVEKVGQLNVDCHKGLWLLLSALSGLGHVTVQFSEHTNSAVLSGNPKQTDVTSYFTVRFIR